MAQLHRTSPELLSHSIHMASRIWMPSRMRPIPIRIFNVSIIRPAFCSTYPSGQTSSSRSRCAETFPTILSSGVHTGCRCSSLHQIAHAALVDATAPRVESYLEPVVQAVQEGGHRFTSDHVMFRVDGRGSVAGQPRRAQFSWQNIKIISAALLGSRSSRTYT